DASGHSETWSIKTNQKGAGNLIFRDWSGGKLSYPNNSNSGDNEYTGDNTNPNLLSAEVRERIFGTGPGVPGRNYLGTGDHLFQYCDDPDNTEYYGYYYYDSLYHAASYNQRAGRFYIYDYLERATDSSTADFLPLNSPYVNTNGRPVTTYSNSGQYGEYNGTTHYQYTGGSGVTSEYWFGLKTDIEFFLPSDPGGKDSQGNNVNQGLNGKDLVFDFTGDDDVWVFVDDILVLDIGGIHNALEGSINFSTGVVTVNGSTSALPKSIGAGEHTLTMYYLERGASQSNCKIKFNITTRYHLKIMKEDVLTRELLDGAEFTVYTDEACTKEAFLWESEAANKAGAEGQSTFVVKNGVANMWGLASGNTYYIKETKYPTNGGYGVANGIIVMQLNSLGTATFDVIPNPDAEGSDLSGGFTVHGFRIDVENHEAYLVATNGKEEYGDEVTSVTVVKEWNDNIDHSKDSITVYILANGFRIQETVLSAANNWTHTWKNLPVKGDSGNPVTYTVEEGTVPGYFGTITPLVSSGGGGDWTEVDSFKNGKTYVIQSGAGTLRATESGGIEWYWNFEEMKTVPEGRWKATVNGDNITLTNEAGQKFYYSSGSRVFGVGKSPPGDTSLLFIDKKIAYNDSGTMRYMDWGNGKTVQSVTHPSGSPQLTLYEESGGETVTNGFLITNEPVTVENSVSFKVNKAWDTGNFASAKDYEQLVVTMKLLENGKDSGMSANLSLKNGWTYTFKDLPKFDSGGKEIVYSVEEVYISSEWHPEYGEITIDGNRYETTVTNVYRMYYELPQTGGGGIIPGIIGGILALGASTALIYRTTKKRRKEDTS
ncbi:MAG: Cna B-type domain-containing protein, partial [Oscillospiraceae bacterium]|nr:Cna B-type domain-containing protein [Oscillospiraceae bacterium]